MASAVSASVKALATKEANRALVEELLSLSFAEQAARIIELRPTTRVKQVGLQLAKALLLKVDYLSKTAEEREAFRLSLPLLHQQYIKLALAKGIHYPASATRKKSAAPTFASASASTSSSANRNSPKVLVLSAVSNKNNTPHVSVKGKPSAAVSEFDKRFTAIKRDGLFFSSLYDITQDPKDQKAIEGYEQFMVITLVVGKETESLIRDIVFVEHAVPGAERDSGIERIRSYFMTELNDTIQYIKKNKIENRTMRSIIASMVLSNDRLKSTFPLKLISGADNIVPVREYLSDSQQTDLAKLQVKVTYGDKKHDPELIASIKQLIETYTVERVALRKAHGTTRKSQFGLRSKSASANVNAAEKVYLKKQMTILGNQTLNWTRKQNALRVLGNERKAYFAPVPFTGPLRDSKGYKQHVGECSTDAIMQVLQQGTPWAAIVQERLYNGTAAEFSAMYDRTLACPGFHPDREDMMALLLNMQERFKLHYTAAKKLEEVAVCVQPFDYTKIGPLLTRKVRKSAELGPGILKNVKKATKAPLYSTYVGYVKHILQLLFHFFGMTDIQCYIRNVRFEAKKNKNGYLNYDIQYKDYKHLAFAFRVNHYPPKDITHHQRPHSGIGHYTAIYKSLDGSWVYYDNEVGVLPLHKTLMGDILNEGTHDWFIAFTYTGKGSDTTLTFYKIPYFNSPNIEELKKKTIEQWREDSWYEVKFRDIAEYSSISTIEEHFHIVSKTSDEPGFDGLYMDDA